MKGRTGRPCGPPLSTGTKHAPNLAGAEEGQVRSKGVIDKQYGRRRGRRQARRPLSVNQSGSKRKWRRPKLPDDFSNSRSPQGAPASGLGSSKGPHLWHGRFDYVPSVSSFPPPSAAVIDAAPESGSAFVAPATAPVSRPSYRCRPCQRGCSQSAPQERLKGPPAPRRKDSSTIAQGSEHDVDEEHDEERQVPIAWQREAPAAPDVENAVAVGTEKSLARLVKAAKLATSNPNAS